MILFEKEKKILSIKIINKRLIKYNNEFFLDKTINILINNN